MSALKKHIRNVHEGLRSKVCNFCGKTFKESHHLKNHIKGVHEGLKMKKSNPLTTQWELTWIEAQWNGISLCDVSTYVTYSILRKSYMCSPKTFKKDY